MSEKRSEDERLQVRRRSIRQLDESVANQIAAGEVVERPGSVVKELVENSIDAGATRIQIAIEQGGVESIRVTDNGSGIPGDQVALAFARHATSKIETADDLSGIVSLGFRGEALPSIASVSHLTLRSRVAGARSGTEIRLEGGVCVALEPVGTPEGTTLTVNRLFYNTPARRKFLKSESAERRHIVELVSRLALAHPSIQFVLEAEGREVLRTPGDGEVRSALAAIYDTRLARELLEFDEETPVGRITGLIAPPHRAKGNRQHLTILVNGRWIQSRALAAAVEKGYGSLLPSRRFPLGLLHLHIDPTHIDVNVHPAKTEVRIQDEREVFRHVLHAVRNRLLRANLIPGSEGAAAAEWGRSEAAATVAPSDSLAFDLPQPKAPPTTEQSEITWYRAPSDRHRVDPETGELLDTPPTSGVSHVREEGGARVTSSPPPADSTPPPVEIRPSADEPTAPIPPSEPRRVHAESTAPASIATPTFTPKPQSATEHWRDPLRDSTPELHRPQGAPDAEAAREILRAPDVLGQVLNTYILVRVPWGLWLLDQHVVHERILYEEVLGRSGRPREVQQLLIPLTYELPVAVAADPTELTTALEGLGFDAETFGTRSLVVRGIPAGLARRPSVTEEILEGLAYAYPQTYVEERQKRLAALIACKGAVKAGDPLSQESILDLLRRLAETANPFACPHGRPVIVELGVAELERRFGRR